MCLSEEGYVFFQRGKRKDDRGKMPEERCQKKDARRKMTEDLEMEAKG